MADRLVLRNYRSSRRCLRRSEAETAQGRRSAKTKFISFETESTCDPSTTPDPRYASGTHSNRPPIVGLVGRLSIEKGVDIFLRAAARVLAELPSTKFVVVGEGPDRDKLESLIDELKLRDERLDARPPRRHAFGLRLARYHGLGVSRQEGLPMAILEGMASSLPLIATAVGEVPTVVLDGRTGVLASSRRPRPPGVRNRRSPAKSRRTAAPRSRGKKANRRRVLRRPHDGRLSPRLRKGVAAGKDKVSHAPAPRGLHDGSLGDRALLHRVSLAALSSTERVDLTVGSISYYLDPTCFSSRGIKLDPGLLDVVGKFPSATTAAQSPQAPGVDPQSLRPHRALSHLSARHHSRAVPADVDVAAPDSISGSSNSASRRGSKIVLTVHDLLPHDTGETHKQTFRDLYRMVDGIICHSDNIRTRLHAEFSVPEEKIAVIPHGPFFYDLPATNPGPDPAKLRPRTRKALRPVARNHLSLQRNRSPARRMATSRSRQRRRPSGDRRVPEHPNSPNKFASRSAAST